MLTRKPRPVDTILSSFTSMVDELNKRSEEAIAHARTQDEIIDTAVSTRDAALSESERAITAAAKINTLVDNN